MNYWRQCQILIIDEISMIDADLFEKLDYVARCLRNSNKAMGGIQVIACGDFFQLPPVSKLLEEGYVNVVDGSIQTTHNVRYCFESPCWVNVFDNMVEFTQVFRQSDSAFVRLLNEIRHGNCSEETQRILEDCKNTQFDANDGIVPTRLYSHNRDVDQVNSNELQHLVGKGKLFFSKDRGEKRFLEILQGSCPAPSELKLKIGAQVLLLKNISPKNGLINGARGVVVEFDEPNRGFPVVKFVNGIQTRITPEKFSLEVAGREVASREQIPLRLAWALT